MELFPSNLISPIRPAITVNCTRCNRERRQLKLMCTHKCLIVWPAYAFSDSRQITSSFVLYELPGEMARSWEDSETSNSSRKIWKVFVARGINFCANSQQCAISDAFIICRKTLCENSWKEDSLTWTSAGVVVKSEAKSHSIELMLWDCESITEASNDLWMDAINMKWGRRNWQILWEPLLDRSSISLK